MLRKPLNSGSKKLKLFWGILRFLMENFICTRPRLVIFKIYHFSKLSFKWVIGLIDLSLDVRFDWFRSEDCWRSNLCFSCMNELRKCSLFILGSSFLFYVNRKSFIPIKAPAYYAFHFSGQLMRQLLLKLKRIGGKSRLIFQKMLFINFPNFIVNFWRFHTCAFCSSMPDLRLI